MVDRFQFSLHILGPEVDKVVSLPAGITTIGREAGNTLVLSDPLISRRHATIECTAADCFITDLNSANGTIVEGQRIAPQVPIPLARNASVKIGPIEIHFVAVLVEQKEEQEAVAPPVVSQAEGPVDQGLPGTEQPEGLRPESITTGNLTLETPIEGPPSEPPAPPPPPIPLPEKNGPIPPPGLSINSTRLIDYLPGIYQQDFTSQFLALFESILFPIEWNIDNFDLFLDPSTSPAEFLPWLMNWFELSFDPTWSEKQRRILLKEANKIFSRRGTAWALSRILEIYLNVLPTIVDSDDKLPPHTFKVQLPIQAAKVNQKLVEKLINTSKPAYTTYTIEYTKK